MLMAASCLQSMAQVKLGEAVIQSICLSPSTVSKFGNAASIGRNLDDTHYSGYYYISNFAPNIVDVNQSARVYFSVDGNRVMIVTGQYLGLSSKYGECYLLKCDRYGNVNKIDAATPEYLEGTIDSDGAIRIPGPWCVACYANNSTNISYKAVRVAENTVIRPANATMEVTYAYKVTDTDKASYPVFVEQGSDYNISVTNFGGFGQVVDINVNSDRTITIPFSLIIDEDGTKRWNNDDVILDQYTCPYISLDDQGVYWNKNNRNISGIITETTISFEKWFIWDYSQYANNLVYKSGRITLNNGFFKLPEARSLTVSPTQLSFDADGKESQHVTVATTNVGWYASSDGWIHCNPMEGRNGQVTMSVTVDPNTSTERRLGEIRITPTGAGNQIPVRTIYVEQAGATKVEMAISGVRYDLDYSTMTAKILDIETDESGKGEVVIPAEIEEPASARDTRAVTNNNFKVNSLGDSIMAKMAMNMKSLNCVTFPKTIENVSEKAFDGAKTKSIVWLSNKEMPKDAFQNLAADKLVNMLVYVNKEYLAPSTISNKVVMQSDGSYKMKNITLYEDNEFYCPHEFETERVTFMHSFEMKTGIKSNGDGAQGWESIVLPFDVESINYEKDGKTYSLVPFDSYVENHNNDDRPFWLYEWDDTVFRSATKMEANKPYLISMPNNSEYASDFCINGNVVFSANNKSVKKTDIEDSYSIEANKVFCASYAFIKSEYVSKGNILCINSESKVSGHDHLAYDYTGYLSGEEPKPGSLFMSLSLIKRDWGSYPFEGFMLTDSSAGTREAMPIEFASASGDSQGIRDFLPSSPATPSSTVIYTLSGQRVATGQGIHTSEALQQLKPGIYLMGGRKYLPHNNNGFISSHD